MAWGYQDEPPASVEDAFTKQTVDTLKPLAQLLISGKPPTRKGELVALLTKHLRDPKEVRRLYEGLEPIGQQAVQEAVADAEGYLNEVRFKAKYGSRPTFYEPLPEGREERYGWYGYHKSNPKTLRLFFPYGDWLPPDLHNLLRSFVPEPPPFTLPTSAEPLQTVTQSWTDYQGHKPVKVSENIAVRVRDTAREAEHDLKAVLRLAEASRLRVTDKKQEPTSATLQSVRDVLLGGDFYTDEDRDEWDDDPVNGLAIKAFAWPMILQAAGLAEKGRGGTLQLTGSGQKALVKPAHEVLRAAWKKWRTTNLLDEFSRVEAIKGQKKGGLSALTTRRKVVADALAHCPPDKWVKIEDFLRFMQATGRDFTLSHSPYRLYIGDPYYGNLEDMGGQVWEQLQGRYIMAVLFEYAGTLGLIDVAFIRPHGAREDYGGSGSADDLGYLSRYDGLLAFRVNSLGAWCLELAEHYEPPAQTVTRVLRVLPNLEVVAVEPPLSAADRLVLERFAEQASENVWKLTNAKLLPLLEEGGSLDQLAEFLTARSGEELPHTVQVFLDDLRERAGMLRDLGAARLIECRDAALARMLAADPQLRDKCQLAGERQLVFRAADEKAVRRALRRLGYILPVQQG